MNSAHEVDRLAQAFIAHLRHNLSFDELHLIDQGYEAPPALIYAAFLDTFNRMPDHDEDSMLIGVAWQTARRMGFLPVH